MEKNTLHPLIGLFCVCMSVSDLTRYKISDRESGKASKAAKVWMVNAHKVSRTLARGSLRECGFVDSTRGVTGRSDIARWDLQKRTNARRTGRTRAMQWGLPRLKAE